MKKAIGILALQAMMVATVYGQFETPKRPEINMVKGKTLLVETQDEVTRTLMDLEKDPAAEQRYKDGVANFNKNIQSVVEKYYKFGKKIEYMTAPKVAALIRDGKASRYAILHYAVQNSEVNPINIGPIYGVPYSDSVRNFSKSKGYGILSIQLIGSDKKPEDVYSIALPVAYPSKADLIYALQTMQYVFGKVLKNYQYEIKDFRAEIEHNNKKLKRRTLLIAKSQVSSSTTLQDLKNEYQYPVEIVDYNTIDSLVMASDSNYAYIEVVPLNSNETTPGRLHVFIRDMVVDAKDGAILATAKPGRMNHEKVADDISKKEIKDFILDK